MTVPSNINGVQVENNSNTKEIKDQNIMFETLPSNSKGQGDDFKDLAEEITKTQFHHRHLLSQEKLPKPKSKYIPNLNLNKLDKESQKTEKNSE